MVDNMSKRGFDPLTYRFEDQAPSPGTAQAIADGVFWIRMPMQGRLNHINVWLLRDYDGWTIVDTGLFNDTVKSHWQTIFDTYLEGRPITRVIATHLHADHTGLAGWITHKWGCELWMSRSDFYMCKVMANGRPIGCTGRCDSVLPSSWLYGRSPGPLPPEVWSVRGQYLATARRVSPHQRWTISPISEDASGAR